MTSLSSCSYGNRTLIVCSEKSVPIRPSSSPTDDKISTTTEALHSQPLSHQVDEIVLDLVGGYEDTMTQG